jgi:hypothetical protein
VPEAPWSAATWRRLPLAFRPRAAPGAFSRRLPRWPSRRGGPKAACGGLAPPSARLPAPSRAGCLLPPPAPLAFSAGWSQGGVQRLDAAFRAPSGPQPGRVPFPAACPVGLLGGVVPRRRQAAFRSPSGPEPGRVPSPAACPVGLLGGVVPRRRQAAALQGASRICNSLT